MAGNKLVTKINLEFNHYLGIPYARNIWKNDTLFKEAIFGGKGTWQQIEYATRCAALKENIDFTHITPKQKYDLQKDYRIGIDCSGLVYHLLDFLDILKGNQGILFKVIGVDKNYGRYGVRVVSAADLTHQQNSALIKNYQEILVGDIIRHNNGTHVLFITNFEGNRIDYIHSSLNTYTEGVHEGYIIINNPKEPLNFQQWSDTTNKGLKYQQLSNPENYDGIYRLKCWL